MADPPNLTTGGLTARECRYKYFRERHCCPGPTNELHHNNITPTSAKKNTDEANNEHLIWYSVSEPTDSMPCACAPMRFVHLPQNRISVVIFRTKLNTSEENDVYRCSAITRCVGALKIHQYAQGHWCLCAVLKQMDQPSSFRTTSLICPLSQHHSCLPTGPQCNRRTSDCQSPIERRSRP